MNLSLSEIETRLFRQQDVLSASQLDELADIWGRAVAEIVGKDEGGQSLQSLLEPYVKKIQDSAYPANAVRISNALSEAVESQRQLAEYLHTEVAPGKLRSQEHLLLDNPSYPETQWISSPQALIAFLKQPLSTSAQQDFITAQAGFPTDKVEAFYQAYWGLPHEQQSAFLGKVFGLDKAADRRSYRQFRNDVYTVVESSLKNDFLPPDTRGQYGDSSAYYIGDMIIKGLIVSSPKKEVVAGMFASMLDAVHEDAADQASPKPRTTDDQERFGYRLGRFMNNLGSGAAKTSQYGHSMPLTPDAWMDGLSASKSEAGRPLRVEYLRWVDAKTPSNGLRSHIVRIGAHKGTGSYVSTYEVELDPDYVKNNRAYARYLERYPDKPLVLSLLKENARENALEFANYFLDLGEAIISMSPPAERSIGPLLEIVKQGIRMVEKETDLTYSAQQEALSGKIHENLRVLAGKIRHSFYNQGAFEHGEEFRISLCVDGTHFNKLPENTPQERATKRMEATVMFASQLYIALSGQALDHDRHGDNEGIVVGAESAEIGNFDSGAQALEQPTVAQKRMFANCLVDTIANSLRNKYGLPSSLKHTVAKAAEDLGSSDQKDLDYIYAMQRAALSWGDYMKYMKPRDYIQAGLAVLQTGEVDPVILSTLLNRATTMGLNKVPGISGMIQLLGSTEHLRESRYYPNNPNPNRGKRPPAPQTQADVTELPAREDSPPLPIYITGGEGERSLLGALASYFATAVKSVIR